jgi:tRNA threonylcarbamoyl adenosine modification protein (Sua5/YciO/YrdC/YwlC family)
VTGQAPWLDTAAVLSALADGAVVLLPTDTLPGLHARLDRPAALAAIDRIKRRPPGKPLLVLAADLAAAQALTATLDRSVLERLDELWPGPFTVILPGRAGLPAAVTSAEGTVAVRVPDWSPLRSLLTDCGPLASTSANRSGQAPSTDLGAARACFPTLPAWHVTALEAGSTASALVDLTGPRPRLLRAGPRPLPGADDRA